jgi:Carbohydrate-binding domain-containing protein Cthe_2159
MKLYTFFALLILLNSCSKTTELVPVTSNPTTGTNIPDVLKPLAENENDADYSWAKTEENNIKLNGTSATITGKGAVIAGANVTITNAGTFVFTGSLADGQIIVRTTDKGLVRLVLKGVDITSKTSSPIFIDKAEKVAIIIADGTENKITDAAAYSNITKGQNAAIYSQTFTSISGQGNLIIIANYKDGIASKDGLLIKNGNIKVTAKDEGIRGKDYLVIRDGKFDITTNTGDGLKSDNESDKNYGYVVIDKGTFKINAQGDGVSAQTTLTVKDGDFNITAGGGSTKTVATGVSAKGFKGQGLVKIGVTSTIISTADDCINSNTDVIIEKGTFQMATSDDGIHANSSVTVKNGNITITKCFEGIEAKTITFEKGNFSINSSNDAINATAGTDAQQNDGSFIYIKGGTFVLDAANGDPLDSNGAISMTDGTIIINGPGGMEVPMDYNATFVVSKGLIIASGGNSKMLQAPSTSSTVNSLKLTFNVANPVGTVFNITDENNNFIVGFKPTKSYQSIIFTSEKLTKNRKYTIQTGGVIIGDNQSGYYSSGTYNGGTQRGSFTVASSVTSLAL